jgi:hypothetical protein
MYDGAAPPMSMRRTLAMPGRSAGSELATTLCRVRPRQTADGL